MNTLPDASTAWHCMHGYVLAEISACILLVSALIKYNATFRNLCVAQMAAQHEIDAFKLLAISTYSPVDALSIQQKQNKNICSRSMVPTILDLRKEPKSCRFSCNGFGYERQTTILVCDGDDHFDALSLKDRLIISKWRRKLYALFDCLCSDYDVLKVPTNGNSYIAVHRSQGLDYPVESIKMLQFADTCQKRLHCSVPLTKLDSMDNLISTMRFGIHVATVSEPYDGSRHDILEDKSNFKKVLHRAKMMQKTSLPGHIHTSKSTAKFLKSFGMDHFVERRKDGRYVAATYWLTMRLDGNVPPVNTETICNCV